MTRNLAGVAVLRSSAGDDRPGPPSLDCTSPSFGALGRGALLVVRSTDASPGPASVVRHTLMDLDPDVALVWTRSFTEQVRTHFAGPLMAAYVTAGIALTGLFLIVVGCFALFASLVKEGIRELAVRLALGATARRVIHHLVLLAGVLTGAGLTIGVVLSLWLRQAFADQLFPDARTDLTPFWAGAGLITAASLGAAYLAARRVRRVDPATLLRYE